MLIINGMGIGTLAVPAGTFHLTGNPIRVNITGATAPAGSIDYRVLLKIESVDGLLVGAPFIDAKIPLSGDASFDISGYVDQPLEKTFDWPLDGGFGPHSTDTLDIRFIPGERYFDTNGDLQENWGTGSATHFVIKGGVSFSKLGYYNEETSSFYEEYVSGGKFLTSMPEIQIVSPWQPTKLWLLGKEGKTVTLKIKGYYEDGTTYTYSSAHGLYVDILHEINCLPYHADSINLPPVKTGGIKMIYYEVWLEGDTETRTFMLDHTYHENCNYLFFLNSLGGVDVVWLNGEVKKGFSSTAIKAIRPWPSDGTTKTRTTIVSSRSGRRTWTINSGWKSRDEIDALSDLLLSKQAWLIENAAGYNNGTLIAVNVANSETALYNTMDDMYSVEIELEEAHENNFN